MANTKYIVSSSIYLKVFLTSNGNFNVKLLKNLKIVLAQFKN
jgi:hypothetical protein